MPKNEWYAQYVTTAKKKSIVGGYPDGTFKPTQEVNRAEFIKMVMSALPFFNTTPKDKSVAIQQYSDVYDLWYTPYVSAGLQLGFLSKTSELKPTAPMQRQAAVEIIYRISKYLEENPSSLAQSDIPYVPEESFTISDPSKIWYQPSPKLGPDQMVVKRDINRTEVFHKLHGYNLDLPELLDVNAFERTDYITDLKSADECITSVAFNAGETVEQTYKSIINPESYMVPYIDAQLIPLPQYSRIKAYHVKIIWEDDDWETYIVEVPNGTLEIILGAYEYDRCAKKYPAMILSGMTIR
ncbi:MAG: S-layer homology domain-containing protein [Candidatus Altimarinota bacterium]